MITAERLKEIIGDVIGEEPDPIVVEGVSATYVMRRSELEKYRGEIEAALDELPDEFRLSGGGGWSFLNGCMTKDGQLWTGMQLCVDWLMVLAIGLDLGMWLLPREIWSALPGGVPYFTYKDIKTDDPQPDAVPDRL